MTILEIRNVPLWRRLFQWRAVCDEIQDELLRAQAGINLAQSVATEMQEKLDQQREGNRTLLAFVKQAHLEPGTIREKLNSQP